MKKTTPSQNIHFPCEYNTDANWMVIQKDAKVIPTILKSSTPWSD